MPTLPSSLLSAVRIEEPRQATRVPVEPGTQFAAVWRAPGEELVVEVHDESLTGLGLIMTDVAAFAVGTHATIVYQSSVLDSEVRHLAPRPDGTWLVGWECRR